MVYETINFIKEGNISWVYFFQQFDFLVVCFVARCFVVCFVAFVVDSKRCLVFPAEMMLTVQRLDHVIWSRHLKRVYVIEFVFTIFLLQLFGSHSVSRFTSKWFCRVCLGTGEFLRSQGAIPPGFYPLREGHCLAPVAPLLREMPMGLNVLLAMPDACGLALWPDPS